MGLVANGFAENHWGNNLEQRIWAPPPETLELDETKPKYMYIYKYKTSTRNVAGTK
jgi:hypothetical protein